MLKRDECIVCKNKSDKLFFIPKDREVFLLLKGFYFAVMFMKFVHEMSILKSNLCIILIAISDGVIKLAL